MILLQKACLFGCSEAIVIEIKYYRSRSYSRLKTTANRNKQVDPLWFMRWDGPTLLVVWKKHGTRWLKCCLEGVTWDGWNANGTAWCEIVGFRWEGWNKKNLLVLLFVRCISLGSKTVVSSLLSSRVTCESLDIFILKTCIKTYGLEILSNTFIFCFLNMGSIETHRSLSLEVHYY
jgi:hypothetical protein